MRHLKFHPDDSEITFEPIMDNDTTPAKAINEAIEFTKVHGLESVDLVYGGFLMCIEPTSDLKELVAEYLNWERLQKNSKFTLHPPK